jgi:hypothetical protein
MSDRQTYPGGWDAVIAQWEGRRAPLVTAPGEAGLPPLDADLAALAAAVVPAAPAGAAPTGARPGSPFARKQQALAAEFAGASALALLNALTISVLRRRDWPDQAPALFRRIWAEHAPALTAELNTRWIVSSVITFADHGQTESERMLGQSMKMLFKLVKLYEYERLWSGLAPTQPFRFGNRASADLPMQINPFSIRDGGLDVNLLAPLWKQALAEPVMGPVTCHLLDRLNADPGTVFRRMAIMRERLLARDARAAARAAD